MLEGLNIEAGFKVKRSQPRDAQRRAQETPEGGWWPRRELSLAPPGGFYCRPGGTEPRGQTRRPEGQARTQTHTSGVASSRVDSEPSSVRRASLSRPRARRGCRWTDTPGSFHRLPLGCCSDLSLAQLPPLPAWSEEAAGPRRCPAQALAQTAHAKLLIPFEFGSQPENEMWGEALCVSRASISLRGGDGCCV